MRSVVETASPLEIASLWHLGFLSGAEVGVVCMRWLEEDLDCGDPGIATFAGAADLKTSDIAPAFERALTIVVGRSVAHEEAILRALRLHLAVALEGDLMEGVQQVLGRFTDLTQHRLVHNPRRSKDDPDGVYAAQELGLEYIYGGFYAFDDIWHTSAAEQAAAKVELRQDLCKAVCELKDHLAATLGPLR